MREAPIAQILTHFMKRGFNVVQEDDFFVLSNVDAEFELLLFYDNEYIQILFVLPLNEKAKINRVDTLERLNAFNEAALISRASFAGEDYISFSAFFPNYYEPKLFSTFIDTFFNDLGIMYGDKFDIFELIPDEEE